MATGEHGVGEHGVEHGVGEHGDRNGVALSKVELEKTHGVGVMPAGRVSIARVIKPLPPVVPFTPVQLSRLDEALVLSSRSTGLEFSVYLGELGEDTRERAETLHASMGARAASDAVLIAVSPGQRIVEIVTGEESHRRLSDRSCKLAVMSMVASFKESDIIGGLVSGLRMLTDQAGSAPKHVGPAGPRTPAH